MCRDTSFGTDTHCGEVENVNEKPAIPCILTVVS